MKCTHCGSEWKSTTAVTECPFCHKTLTAAPAGPKTLTSTLAQLRDQLGIAVMGNSRMLISSFKDIAPELEKERIRLSHLEKCDGIKILFAAKDASPADQKQAVNKVVHTMTDKYGLQESVARSVCQAYMLVLTGKEAEEQTPNSEASLTEFREKLVQKLRENIPAPTATPTPTATAAPPKPAAPVTTPKSAATAPVTPTPSAKATPPEFQVDWNGKLLKYNGTAAVPTIPADVKIIGTKAFAGNQSITQIRLPEGLLGIDGEAFAGCSRLQSVILPSTLYRIGAKAFWSCNSIKEITLPGSVRSISPLAFWACNGLTTVTLQEGITEIGENAFHYCSNLTRINLPKSLKTVHINAFAGAMNAHVYGNSNWTVKDGHVVAGAPETTYRNAGASQKTVISPVVTPPKSNESRAYQNEQPKPPVTPPKPSAAPKNPPVAPPPPPVTPQAKPSAAKPAKKTPWIMRLLGSCMYLTWGAAVFMFFDGIAPINTDGSFYYFFLVLVALFIAGRVLFAKSHAFWGLLLSFLAAGNLIQFYQFSPDSTVNNIIIIAYPILCAVTSFCHKPIFSRSRK